MPGQVSGAVIEAIARGEFKNAVKIYQESCEDKKICPKVGLTPFCSINCLRNRMQYLSLYQPSVEFQKSHAAYDKWCDVVFSGEDIDPELLHEDLTEN